MKKLLLAATVCIAIAPATASAQSWGRGGAYTGAGSNEVVRTTNQGYYPRTGSHSCNWSVAASCAAWRSGIYDRDGVRHQLVRRYPNGRWTVRVFHNGVRVK